MKSILLAVLTLLASSQIALAGEPQIICVVNAASWCPACQANGARVEQTVVPELMKAKTCKTVVMNDLSDDNTKVKSMKMLEEAGLAELAPNFKATGMIYFIDSVTRKVVSEVSVTKTNDEIKSAYQKAVASTKA